MSRESEISLWVVPSVADSAAPGRRGWFRAAWVGSVRCEGQTKQAARVSSLPFIQRSRLGYVPLCLLPFVQGVYGGALPA